MAFKLVCVLCIFGLALADYEYSPPTAPEVPFNPPTGVQNGDLLNNNDINNNNNNNNYQQNTNANNYDNNNYNYNNNYNNNNINNNNIPINTNDVNANAYNNANNLGHSQPPSSFGYNYTPRQYHNEQAYNNAPAKYDYSYSVHDDVTGDIKSHSESRDGYLVRGVYSVVDPDGFKRTVTYTADDLSGFNAVVNREPYALKVAPAVITKAAAVVAAPQAQPQPQLAELSLNGGSNSNGVEQSQVAVPQPPQAQQPLVEPSQQIDLPVQAHDSYAAPLAKHSDGHYP